VKNKCVGGCAWHKCNGEMPIIILGNTLKYIEINSSTFKCTINLLKYLVNTLKYTINILGLRDASHNC
jgi:hypothetical protein